MNGRPMVAGRATGADGIIMLAGAANAITEYDGYKPINDEAVIAARPDAILAMERASFRLDAKTVFEHPAFATTPAAAQRGLSRWRVSTFSASVRAPRAPRAISPSRSIRRW